MSIVFYAEAIKAAGVLLHRSRIARSGLAFILSIGSISAIAQPSFALTAHELHRLCDRYPLNAQCEGYETPIPLTEREGKKGRCSLQIQESQIQEPQIQEPQIYEQLFEGRCKVNVSGTGLFAYVEFGERLGFIGNALGTKALVLTPEEIDRLSYQSDLAPSNAQNLTRFLHEIATDLIPQSASEPPGWDQSNPSISSDSNDSNKQSASVSLQFSIAAADNPTRSNPTRSGRFVFISERRSGEQFRDDVQRLTGLTPED